MGESWSCDADGGASCDLEETNCGCDGKSITTGGYSEFDSEGNELGVGEGWNCFSKCQEKRRRKGTQEKVQLKVVLKHLLFQFSIRLLVAFQSVFRFAGGSFREDNEKCS